MPMQPETMTEHVPDDGLDHWEEHHILHYQRASTVAKY